MLHEVLGLTLPATAEEIESLPVGRVELERRRLDKNGKMKQKLSCVGINCNKCSICLLQFKEDELAVGTSLSKSIQSLIYVFEKCVLPMVASFAS